MKDYTRREFLKSGLLTSAAFFFSFGPVGKLLASNSKNPPDSGNISTQADIRQLQQKAKDFFYHKNYSQAELYYRQIILLQPSYVAAYDGLAKTLYAQNKSLAAAEAYRQGWLDRQDNHMFCDRLARAMKRLVAGNRKDEKEFCSRIGQTELLAMSAQLYIDAIDQTQSNPKPYLALGLLDVQRTLDKCNKSRKHTGSTALSFSSSLKKQITQYTQTNQDRWQATRKKRKKHEYNLILESDAIQRETKNQKKDRRTLYFDKEAQSRTAELNKGKKNLYYPFFAAAIKNKSTSDAERLQQKILSLDATDKNVNGQLIRHYRKQKNYTKLVQFTKDQYNNQPGFWATVSYAQALRLQAKKESRSNLCNKAISLYKNLETSKSNLSSSEFLCVYGGQLDCLLQQQKYTELRATAIRVMAPYPLSILPFVLVYIKSWVNEGKLTLAEDAYKMLTTATEMQSISTDPIFNHLKASYILLKEPTGKPNEVPGFGVKKETLFDIYYAMANLYRINKNKSAEFNMLSKIKRIDPNNDFVKKRIA